MPHRTLTNPYNLTCISNAAHTVINWDILVSQLYSYAVTIILHSTRDLTTHSSTTMQTSRYLRPVSFWIPNTRYPHKPFPWNPPSRNYFPFGGNEFTIFVVATSMALLSITPFIAIPIRPPCPIWPTALCFHNNSCFS